MKIGIIGLGRMGLAIAQRALRGKHYVVGFDQNMHTAEIAKKNGVAIVADIQNLIAQTEIIWLMIPPTAVDSVLNQIKSLVTNLHVVIDGGNSDFKDSIRRAKEFNKLNVHYLDCGTSGGLQGKEIGFSLMIGGAKEAFEKLIPLFTSIAAQRGFAYIGESGTGHYVKMVHNGIEYALMQSYAEGFHLLKKGHFKNLDLEKISEVWNNGAIIRSWLLELCHEIFQSNQTFENISGKIAQTGMGKWTVDEAHSHNIPVKLIEDAVKIRDESVITGGTYATKIVALLRNKFGGHPLSQ